MAKIRDKIHKCDAGRKIGRAELSELAQSFHFDISTDFGQVEQVIQDRIDRNRAKASVAADLSSEGLMEAERGIAMEGTLAEEVLRGFEVEVGMITPQTAVVSGLWGPHCRELSGGAQPDRDLTTEIASGHKRRRTAGFRAQD